MVKMAFQISIIEAPANQENRCSTLQASVCSGKLPMTFVGRVSFGKSRVRKFQFTSVWMGRRPRSHAFH
jgi:hypothetical protein